MKWRSRSPKAMASVWTGGRSPVRGGSRSAFQLFPLRSCASMNAELLYSDGEDDEGKKNSPDETSIAARQKSLSARALSCPKLGSPLSACTPFSVFNVDEQMRYEEETECLRPCGSLSLDSCGSSSMGSSPLKLSLAKRPSTPKGYVAVYVGEERKRFLVKANVMNHPLFGLLLEKAREEFGFQQKGALNIPCEVAFFRRVMLLVESECDNAFYQNADPATILPNPNNKMAASHGQGLDLSLPENT